jgi:hypothetical protein
LSNFSFGEKYYSHENQPQSKKEATYSDSESLKPWSTNNSNAQLTPLIEKEALSDAPVEREISSPTKQLYSIIFGLTLCSLLYGLGLTLLSQTIYSLAQQAVTEWVRYYRTLEEI